MKLVLRKTLHDKRIQGHIIDGYCTIITDRSDQGDTRCIHFDL